MKAHGQSPNRLDCLREDLVTEPTKYGDMKWNIRALVIAAAGLGLFMAAPTGSAKTPCLYHCSNDLGVCLEACSGAEDCRNSCANVGAECRAKCVQEQEAGATEVSPEDKARIDKAAGRVMEAIDEEEAAVKEPIPDKPAQP
jgi:hypothetical protein